MTDFESLVTEPVGKLQPHERCLHNDILIQWYYAKTNSHDRKIENT